MSSIFKEEKNTQSGRFAIIEENGMSAWLYLTHRSGKEIQKDAFIYSPIDPIEKLNIEEIKNGGTPVLIKSVASEVAVIKNVKESELSLMWSSDGNSVAVLYKNVPMEFINMKVQKSYSKALTKKSGFGEPWNQDLYAETFE